MFPAALGLKAKFRQVLAVIVTQFRAGEQVRTVRQCLRQRRLPPPAANGEMVAAIQRLAEDLTRKLMRRDPLSERVRHTRLETIGLLALAAKDRLVGRGVTARAA